VTEGGRFVDFFLRNKPVQPLTLAPVFNNRKWRITRIALKSIFIIFASVFPVVLIAIETAEYGEEHTPPLYGIYTVQEFVRNNDTIPPLITDSTRWGKLLLEYEGSATVLTMNNRKKYVAFETDTIRKIVTMYSGRDTANKYHLGYTVMDSTLILQGIFRKDTLYIKMQRYNDKKFLLTNRGFHWINEYPFNR
jgi:hypothetical protein